LASRYYFGRPERIALNFVRLGWEPAIWYAQRRADLRPFLL